MSHDFSPQSMYGAFQSITQHSLRAKRKSRRKHACDVICTARWVDVTNKDTTLEPVDSCDAPRDKVISSFQRMPN